jgi:LemA protein
MTSVYVVIGVAALVLLWLVVSYNALVAARNRTDEAWSGIDVQLKRRHDLVPNLVAAVRGYAAHEAETLQRVVEARASAIAAQSPAARAEAERRLGASLGAVNVLAEQYPQLQAAAAFIKLQGQLSEAEDEIQAARRIYNADVRLYLTRKQSFPTALITGLGDFPDRPYFELDGTHERAAPQVSFASA